MIRGTICIAPLAALLASVVGPSDLSAQGRIFAEFERSKPKVGAIAPDFTLETLEGTPFTLSEAYATRPVVIEFGSFT